MRYACLLLFACSLLTAPRAFSCMNEYGEMNLTGEQDTHPTADILIYYRTFNQTYSQELVDSYDLDTIPITNYKVRSDIAFHLTHLGRYQEALVILKELYTHYPNEYAIQANLGTVYELNGFNEEALAHIRECVRRYPQSHQGSEWFHVKVLEAKLRQAKKPDWLLTHKVLNLGIDRPSVKYLPASPEDDASFRPYTPQYEKNLDIISDIKYQLKERIPFTPAPDLLLANVLTELGDILAIEFSISEAYIIYQMALVYDPTNTYHVKAKLAQLTKAAEKYKQPLPRSWRIAQYFPPLDSMPPIDQVRHVEYIRPADQVDRLVKLQEQQLREEGNHRSNTQWYWLTGIFAFSIGAFAIYRKRNS